MLELLADTLEDLHAITAHFPIALLVVSAGVSVALRIKSSVHLQHTSWLLLWIGTLGAIIASVTGLISHFPYEETELHAVIEVHQMWSFAVTAFFIVLTGWRWFSRRRGTDAGTTPLYLVVILVGMVGLVLSGMTGGDLVYDYGINVRGVNPLLGR